MEKPKVTFEAIPVVCIRIRGEEDKEKPMCLPKDDGLVSRFLKFQIEQEIFQVPGCGDTCGPGIFVGFFTAKDAKKLVTWLRKQGAKKKRNR